MFAYGWLLGILVFHMIDSDREEKNFEKSKYTKLGVDCYLESSEQIVQQNSSFNESSSINIKTNNSQTQGSALDAPLIEEEQIAFQQESVDPYIQPIVIKQDSEDHLEQQIDDTKNKQESSTIQTPYNEEDKHV